MKRAVAALAALPLVWLAGFGVFLLGVPSHRADPALAARDPPDAVVVLTGPDDARLSQGFDLFAAGIAPRLFISGVEPGLDMTRVLAWGHRAGLRLPPGAELGFAATDTAGNAREVAGWARAHDVHRIWLVTADYHMPRALWLLRLAAPDLRVVPDPTVWAHGQTLSRLHYGLVGLGHRVSEYDKLLVQHVLLRTGLLHVTG